MHKMRAYGIDPGLVNTAVACLDEDGELIGHKLIKTKASQPLADRLHYISAEVLEFVNGQEKAIYAIEETIVGRGMRSALLLAHGRAAAMLGLPRGAKVYELPPTVVKKHFAGTGGADKVYMKKILGLERNQNNNKLDQHTIDAIAVARTALWLHKQSKTI